MMTAAEKILEIRREVDQLIDRLEEVKDNADDLSYSLNRLRENLYNTYEDLGYLTCRECGGKGYVIHTTEDGIKLKQICISCNGTGIEPDFSRNLENITEED